MNNVFDTRQVTRFLQTLNLEHQGKEYYGFNSSALFSISLRTINHISRSLSKISFEYMTYYYHVLTAEN